MADKRMTFKGLDGPSLLDACGDDAQKWAQAFLELNPKCGVAEDVMIGWFANAIEHSSDMRIPGLAPVRLDDGSAFFVSW
jgi:hypothetical protein